jgi:hypothetical protein
MNKGRDKARNFHLQTLNFMPLFPAIPAMFASISQGLWS